MVMRFQSPLVYNKHCDSALHFYSDGARSQFVRIIYLYFFQMVPVKAFLIFHNKAQNAYMYSQFGFRIISVVDVVGPMNPYQPIPFHILSFAVFQSRILIHAGSNINIAEETKSVLDEYEYFVK